MSEAKSVNPQITDAITQSNVSVIADSPAQSMGLVYQSMSHSLSLAMQNAVAGQNNMQQISTSIVSTACANILALASEQSSTQPKK